MSSNQTISEFIRAQDFCESVFDGTHESPKKTEIGRKLVTSKHLKGNQILLDEAYLISEEDFEKISARSSVAKHDLLFSMIGTVGEVVVLDFDPDFAVKNLGVLRAKNETDAYWLYYYLKSSLGREYVQQAKQGSTQQFIPLGGLRNFPVPVLGDLQFRHRQVSILRKIDEKIRINQRIASTLEQIAQTIFKSWFVDFDPVHAKARGEQPVGMDAETAALFPDSFEDSELGQIPMGWKVQSADELFEMSIGRTPPRKEPQWFCDGCVGVPWVSIRDMGTFGVYSGSTNEGLTKEAVEKFKVPTVPADSVLMSFKLTVGKLCITDRAVVTNEAIAHFKPNNSNALSANFAYLWLKQFDVESLDSTSSIATATNSGAIRSISFLIPSDMVITEFNVLMNPLFSEIKTLTHETQTLVQIRDSLLPRLISGELEIPAELLET